MNTTTDVPTAADLAVMLAVDQGDDDLTHIVRPCAPDVGMCGREVPGDEWRGPDDEAEECPACLAVARTGDTVHDAGCATCRDAADDWWLTQ